MNDFLFTVLLSIHIVFVSLLYYALAVPSRRLRNVPWIKGHFAHRGLYAQDQSIPENSLAAFQAAVDHGYGIELDIQMSQEGVMMVFHDDDLLRMTKTSGILERFPVDRLRALTLASTQEKIPLFQEVLDLVDGKVPLLIEFKTTSRRAQVVKTALDLVKSYPGNYAFCSFDPLILWELKKQDPSKIRGLNMEYSLNKRRFPLYQRIILHFGFLNFLIRPDYLSVDYKFQSAIYYYNRLFLKTFGMKWAIPTQDIEAQIASTCDTIIFERYLP